MATRRLAVTLVLPLIAACVHEASPAPPEALPPGETCDDSGWSALPLSVYDAEELGDFKVLWHPSLASEERAPVRAALVEDLSRLAAVVSPAALARLRGTRIVVDGEFIDADGANKRGLATHRSADWLVRHGFDAAREGVVEVYDSADYLRYRAGPQPMVLQHELTHVLHLHADGQTRETISSAHRRATEGGRYANVAHVDGVSFGRAYAMNNPAEYAAELSEAYFGQNDWFPFSRAELRAFDAAGCAAVARLWMVDAPDC